MDSRAREEFSRYRKSSVDLASELEAMIRVTKYLREKIEADMTADKGFERGKLIKAISDLTRSFSSAVDAKVKLDKHLSAEAEALSEDEQIEAVIGFIKELSVKKRQLLVQECVDYHRKVSPKADGIL